MGIVHFRSIERRRTARVALCVDLLVHGETDSNGPFKVEARTLSVSRHGAMMVFEPEVTVGQKLKLINANTGQKAECRVVSVKSTRDGKRNVAFEFTSAEVNFWKMWFPAAGVKPVRRAIQATFRPLPSTEMAR
jgi:c-di-GMP-binding flagellar brake protein YcgR